MKGGGKRYVTVGVKRPRSSSLCFVDLDTKDMDVYKTKDGYHIVAKLSHKFDYHFRRLRIAPKWNKLGVQVNPEPRLVYCGCPETADDKEDLDFTVEHHIQRDHRDKRKGNVQVYITRSD